MASSTEEIIATGLASTGVAGYIGIAANVAQLGDSAIRLTAYLKKKIHPSLQDDLEDLSYTAALIYSRFSRRCLLYGLASLLISGYVAINMPWDMYTEMATDFVISAIPCGSMLLTLFRRRLHRTFNVLVPISGAELRFLLAYERLVDRYIGKTMNSPKVQTIVRKYEEGEIDRLMAEPRLIGGKKDVRDLLSAYKDMPQIATVARLNPHRAERFAQNCWELTVNEQSVFGAIGYNNLAVVAWKQGQWTTAKDYIEEASLRAATAPEVLQIVEHNRQIINDDAAIMNAPEPPAADAGGMPDTVHIIRP